MLVILSDVPLDETLHEKPLVWAIPGLKNMRRPGYLVLNLLVSVKEVVLVA